MKKIGIQELFGRDFEFTIEVNPNIKSGWQQFNHAKNLFLQQNIAKNQVVY